jgi:predicted DCC family thiol-disulfide oxidoreductase YuxK
MPHVTVWFDGNCPLCMREIALMRRLDKRGAITFLDLMHETTDCPVNRADMLARFHAAEDGMVLSGAAAFAAMWRAIPLLRPLGLLARNRHVLRLLEALYLRFLRFRPALQARMRRT